MGQAQRKDRQNISRNGLRTVEAVERDVGSSVKNGMRNTAKSSRNSARNTESRKNVPRSDRPHDVELWEINRENGQPKMMRLANPPARTRSAQAAKRRRAKRRKVLLYRLFAFLVIAVCLILIYQTTGAIYHMTHKEKTEKSNKIVEIISEKIEEEQITPPEILEDFLEINDYSRPGTKLGKVKSVFVHYTANPGTSAQQNRSYFANLAETQERSASAHFIIGYEGELVQCIPLDEQAYAVATRNEDSVSIECCYLDEDGKFTQETYDTLIHTLAWLVQEYDLSTEDILRHYDCGGKKCPLYYVEHEDAWEKLLSDVENYEL